MNRPAAPTACAHLVLSLILALSLPACGGGASRSAPSGRAAASSAAATAQPVCAAGDTLDYAAATLNALGTAHLRIDFSSAGPRATPLGYVRAVAPLGGSSVAAADGMARDVVLFDTAGAVRAHFGRRGGGPGEFRSVSALAGEGDTLIVADPAASRLTYFDARGEVLATQSLPALQIMIGQLPELRFFRGGVMATGYQGFRASLQAALHGRRAGAVRGTAQLVAWHTGDSTWTVLGRVSGPEYAALGGGGYGALSTVPFSPRPLWGVARDGRYWYADAARFVLTHMTPTGARICTLRVASRPVAVSDSERTAFYSAVGVNMPAAMLPRVRQERRAVPLPAYKPALRGLVGTDGGGVWVQASAAADAPGSVARRWYRFSASGRPQPAVVLPDRFRLTAVHGDRVYGVASDSLGVQSVEVLSVGG